MAFSVLEKYEKALPTTKCRSQKKGKFIESFAMQRTAVGNLGKNWGQPVEMPLFFLFSTSYNDELLKKWAIRRAEAWKCAAWRTGLLDTETPPPQPRR